MRRLKGIDETFRHEQQEACHVVQRLAAVDLRLCDDWARLGRTEGRAYIYFSGLSGVLKKSTAKQRQRGDAEREENWDNISAPDLYAANPANLIDPKNCLYFIHIQFPALSEIAQRRKSYKSSILCFIEDHNWNDSKIFEPDLPGPGLQTGTGNETCKKGGGLDCGISREAGAESDLIIKTIMWRQSLHCPACTQQNHTAENNSASTLSYRAWGG